MDNYSNVDKNILNMDEIDWHPLYKLNKASLGQIMQTFVQINFNPKNNYEKIINKTLKIIIPKLIESFKNIIIFENESEKQVYYYNLLGNLPQGMKINIEKHKNIFLKKANIGNLILALRQRITFILTRNVPKMYKENLNYLNAFNKMKKNLNNFLSIIENFEDEFVNSIDEAHKIKIKN